MSDLFGEEHVRRYIETDGEEGYTWREGSPILLLTTTGRKSGTERTMPLIFGEADGSQVLVASRGGAPEHPAWYLSLEANPRVWVQQGAETFWTVAHTAGPDEKPRLWDKMVGLYPDYADYQVKTDREIPVVVLTRD